MFHNLTGEPKRWMVVLMTADDVIDPEKMQRLHGYLPRDARSVSVESQMGNQLAVIIESGEFMPVPHAGTVPMKTIEQLKKR